MEDMLEVVDDASMSKKLGLRLAAEESEWMNVRGTKKETEDGDGEFDGGLSWRMDAEVATKSGERVLLARE